VEEEEASILPLHPWNAKQQQQQQNDNNALWRRVHYSRSFNQCGFDKSTETPHVHVVLVKRSI